MAVPHFKLNPEAKAKWRAAIAELAMAKGSDPQAMKREVLLSARRFVKNVAAITPPATGTLDGAAKKRGEQAILGDLLKIALPATVAGTTRQAREALASASDLLAVHDSARSHSAGRVNPRNRKDKLLVSQSVFNQTLAMLQKRVGWLAAGLNAAAEKLGFALPAWIKRHGSKYGKIEVKTTDTSIGVLITQNVPYADDADGYARKWNFALLKEVQSLIAQAKAVFARKAARAKARLK